MKYSLLSAVIAMALFHANAASAQEVILVAPGGMRCATDRMAPDFEHKTGHPVKVTIGSGGIVLSPAFGRGAGVSGALTGPANLPP